MLFMMIDLEAVALSAKGSLSAGLVGQKFCPAFASATNKKEFATHKASFYLHPCFVLEMESKGPNGSKRYVLSFPPKVARASRSCREEGNGRSCKPAKASQALWHHHHRRERERGAMVLRSCSRSYQASSRDSLTGLLSLCRIAQKHPRLSVLTSEKLMLLLASGDETTIRMLFGGRNWNQQQCSCGFLD